MYIHLYFHSPQQTKDNFYADLQIVLDRAPDGNLLIILGYWNAIVGSNIDGMCDDVLGKHGLGKFNVIVALLLQYKWFVHHEHAFEKRDIHKQSWQHPETKLSLCIDFILMRQSQRKWCSDAQVMREAECWSDHKMVRGKLVLKLRQLMRRKNSNLAYLSR